MNDKEFFLELSSDFKIQNKFKLNSALNRIGYLDSNKLITTKTKVLNKSSLTEFLSLMLTERKMK